MATPAAWSLSPDRCFAAEPVQRQLARELYASVCALPLVCPHGHVDPVLLADPTSRFAGPAEVFVRPDHYVFRMLYSQGVPMEDLGVPTRDGTPFEPDGRVVWRRFCEFFHLFAATPSGLWLKSVLVDLFGIDEKPSAASADALYEAVARRLAEPGVTPRALFARFNIEIFATTDAATDPLRHHESLWQEGWTRVRPTFRPDALVNLAAPGWRAEIDHLADVSGVEVVGLSSFIRAIEQRRDAFRALGCFATDHAAVSARAEPLPASEAERIFAAALAGAVEPAEATAFGAHMLYELARMSTEDGLVMQLHVGSVRDHNRHTFERFGPDTGADIPTTTDWTHGPRPLLNAFGNDPRFRLILFTLDESTYARELAPLAGHYPAVLLGPPWWFFDSVSGMERYLDSVVETAGVYNLAGFNDDARAFTSIGVRHDLWRRVTANWLAGKVVRGLLDEDDAPALARELAYDCARRAYRLRGD